MIALPIISQTKYITKNDTLVCYTHQENREIAKIFILEEKEKQLNVVNDRTIHNLKSDFISLDFEFNKCIDNNNLCINQNDSLITSNNNLKDKVQLQKYIIYGSTLLNIILIIIIL